MPKYKYVNGEHRRRKVLKTYWGRAGSEYWGRGGGGGGA